MGTLFSTPPTDNPSTIMTISNLVRLPLFFVSGVFLPISEMPTWGQWLSRISPLTYTTELVRHATGDATHIGAGVCIMMLSAFALAFWWVSMTLHRRNMSRRLA
jgi:ABC-2 type transport system permease protein